MLELFKGTRATSRGMMIFAVSGFTLHTLFVLMRLIQGGHMPVTSLHEAASFFAWNVVLVFFIIEIKYKVGLLGAFILPVAFILMLSSSILPREINPLSPVLQNYWLWVHTLLAFTGDAAFAVACCVGVMYLIQEHFVKAKKLGGLFHRLPSLRVLDEVNYRLITIGFPLLTLAILTGAVWAQGVWGTFWRWDPKEVWSLITWFFYALIIHARIAASWHGKRAAILSIAGFIAVLFTFYGVSILLKTMHEFK